MRKRFPISLSVAAAVVAALALEAAPGLGALFGGMGTQKTLADTVSFTNNSASVTEGNSGTANLVFPLTISPAAPMGGITLTYTVTNGTASAGTDFTDPGSGTLVIPQGSTSFALPITVNGDSGKEADETFTVTLTGASGGYGTSGTATGTILNDDYQCATPAIAPCWTSFTVDNNAAPAGLQLQAFTAGSNVQVQLKYNNNLELSGGGLTDASVVHMVLNLGTYDPVVFGTTGLVQAYSETTGTPNTLTLDVRPQASSWRGAAPGCTTLSCGSDISPVTADHDYSDVVLGFVSDMSTSGASNALKNAMRGTWVATNAQAFSLPTFNTITGAVGFTVAAPHFKANGSTLNTGFFQFFAPDALVVEMGIADPNSVTNGSFSIASSNGGSVTFSPSHVNAPDGVLIEVGTNPPSLPTFGYSSPTFTVTKAATAPGAPSGISAVAGDSQATVSFTAPNANGAAISSYTVTASPGGATAIGSSSPITVGGLANGTSYTFTVTATNSVGTGPASAASTAVTPTAPASVPGAPSGVSATAGDGQATVSFTAPNANGAAISSYTVTASPGGATASAGSSPITIGGLSNGTAYSFTVTATNPVGTGPASAASAAVTPTAPAAPSSSEPAPVTVTQQTGPTTEASIAAGKSASLTLALPPDAPANAAPSVSWGSGTFAASVSLTAVTEVSTATSTPSALNGFSAGSLAVELSFTSDGNPVHEFAEPLEIVFPAAPPALAPGYSSDNGATWRGIPLLAGTTLPAGQHDGYYRDAAGAVHILTLHASYFGLIGSLVLHYGTRPAVPVGSRQILVFLAPERQASATVVLETRQGRKLRTLKLMLPAETTRLSIHLPAKLKAGLYLVKVTATSGPSTAHATLRVRLTGKHRR